MTRRMFLMLGLGLALVLSSDALADESQAGPPQPKLFASVDGTYAFKALPDGSVTTRAGQTVGTSEGVFFTLDESGKEKVIWRVKLVNIPNRAILVESGKYVITLDSWRRAGVDHCLGVYGEKRKGISDFQLEGTVAAQESEGLAPSV